MRIRFIVLMWMSHTLVFQYGVIHSKKLVVHPPYPGGNLEVIFSAL